MNFLVIDTDRCGVAICQRAAAAGHTVKYFLKPDKGDPTGGVRDGEGFGFERITNWVAALQWADLTFCTQNGDYLQRLDFFKSKGKKIFAPSAQSADLEIKRALGMQFLEEHDIEVPAYQTFKSLKEAEAHVWKTGERYVFKTLGDNEDKALSYCSKSPADLIAKLRLWDRHGVKIKGEVMLQEFIDGIEFAVSRWLGSAGFIGKYNENFEHKTLMAGGSGPNTGEMGTVMKYVDDSPLGDAVLGPLEEALLDLGHLGDIDVNCIIDSKGQAWPLEFTCRPGWPAFNIMLSEHQGDPIQWMLDAVNGKDTLQVSTDVTVGVLATIPPFPTFPGDPDQTVGFPIHGVTQQNERFIYPLEVYLDTQPTMKGEKIVEQETWTTGGEYVAVVTGMGKNICQAADRAYKTMDELKVSDKMVRNDIGYCLEDKVEELHTLGYAESFEFGVRK